MEKILRIEKLVHGGFGLSRSGEGVVFVSGALPGETVRAVLTSGHGGQFHATSVEVLEPSMYRQKPACALAGICGGCDWLHIRYDAQLSIKREIFEECLRRVGKIGEFPEIAIHPSPEFGYRRRVQIKVDPSRATAGFFKRRSAEVVPVSHCPLLSDELNALLALLYLRPEKLPTGAREIKAISGTYATVDLEKREVPLVATAPVLAGVTGKETIIDVASRRFLVRGDGFFQSNLFLCGEIGLCASEWISGQTLWDLFGGAGFFSVFLAPHFESGTTVDDEQSSVSAASVNLAANGIKTVLPLAQTAAGFLLAAKRNSRNADCVVVDPPRSGLDKSVRSALADIKPPTILSVSCDPATQARDAGFLVASCGYRIERAALFDFYPQTHHLETMLLLKR